MAFVTKQQVFDKARILLGDSEVPGGQVFTDDGANGTWNLSSLLETPYAEAYRHLGNFESPFTKRNFHALVAAHQSHLDPAGVGITNVGEILDVRSRPVAATLAIAAVTPDLATSICRVQTSTAHGLSSGDNVVILGTIDAITNIADEWPVLVADADEFDLLGCRADGTWTSGGSVVVPSGAWSLPLVAGDSPLDLEIGCRPEYTWEGDILRFKLAAVERLVKVSYKISATLPASDSGSLAPDDMKDYFTYRLAGLAAEADGDYETAQRMKLEAVGPDPERFIGGFLGQLLDRAVKVNNKVVRRFPSGFRSRRYRTAFVER